ncbi:hypothetical protein MKX03_000218, partial [Papaver bracteatum]
NDRENLQKIENPKSRLSARDSKYLKIKEKFMVSVSNTKKNAIRERNQQVKSNTYTICTRYGHPLINFDFPEVSANKDEIDISSSEEDYEKKRI